MQVEAIIKVQKVGDSLMVIIPSKTIPHLGVQKGDTMQVMIDGQNIIYTKQGGQA